MQRHVEQCACGVLDRLESLIEVLRLQQSLDQTIRNRLAGLNMKRVLPEHLGLQRPMLEQLRRQFDEVAQHACSRKPLVRDLRQQPVQAVTEFVKQRAHVVHRQQGRRTLRKIVVVDHDRQHVAVDARLRAVVAHPRAAALGRAREVVVQEDADRILAAPHLVHPHVGVIGGDIGPTDELDAE